MDAHTTEQTREGAPAGRGHLGAGGCRLSGSWPQPHVEAAAVTRNGPHRPGHLAKLLAASIHFNTRCPRTSCETNASRHSAGASVPS